MILKRMCNSRHMYILFNEQFSLSCLSDVCGRHVKYTAVIKGYALYGHVIQNLTLPVDIQDPCRTQCVMESRCVAINISPHFGDHIICELSDSDGTEYPQDLKPRNDFIYIGTEVRVWIKQIEFFFFFKNEFFCFSNKNRCSNNPCLNNGTCLNGYTKKGYICLCGSLYSGENCETGNTYILCWIYQKYKIIQYSRMYQISLICLK